MTVTEKQFNEDTKDFELTISHDDGVHRHLTLRNKNGDFNRSHQITTWPDHLCISGDMGCYVFSRVEDMFRFFRQSTTDRNRTNEGYWSEKLKSDSTFVGHIQFSEDAFREAVMDYFDEWDFNDEDEKAEVLQHLEDNLLCAECVQEAHELAHSYESPHGHDLPDFSEHRLTEASPQYTWCLYAIVRAIELYDEATK